MNFSDKIVSTIPLQNLWTQENQIEAQRISYLTKDKLKELLKKGRVKFVVADVGQNLKWIDEAECFSFWKSEVEKHLADNINKIDLDIFPDNYAYIASEWTANKETPIVLLEKAH
jgi:kynurenine formamidase